MTDRSTVVPFGGSSTHLPTYTLSHRFALVTLLGRYKGGR